VIPDPQLRDLQAFRYKIHYKAGSGEAGQGARKHGARGEDVVIKVPLGTQVWCEDELIADLVEPGQQVLLAKGGTGGRGNARFVNSVRQAPKFAELGEAGESMWVRLSLKLMADAGLAGLPNAGKSSLLRRLSNAKPKVADYPFTTIEPMLGIVEWSGEADVFTLADVPGLLEGASEGVGLGHEFLAHLERCQLILHVVDVTGYYGADPVVGFRTILGELDSHGEGLGSRPQVIVLNKIDALESQVVEEWVTVFRREVEHLREAGHPAFTYLFEGETPAAEQLVWPVSAATGAGLSALLHWVGPVLRELTRGGQAGGGSNRESQKTRLAAVEVAGSHGVYRPLGASARLFVVEQTPDGYSVKGRAVRRLVTRFDLTNDEAIRYLGERLDKLGVYSALRAKGARPGDEVDIEGFPFEFR
jgi:GTP-binding protein